MKKVPHSYVCVFLLAFISGAAIAQVDVSTITARAGVIRTLQEDGPGFSGHIWAFYPEIQVGGRLFTRWLNWGVSWGYWTDGVERALPLADYVTYAGSGHIVSLRTGFKPQEADAHWPLPLDFIVGVAEHFQSSKYMGGRGLIGDTGISSSSRATTLFGGLGLLIRLNSMIQLEAEVAQFIPLGSGGADAMQKNRRQFNIGISLDI